MHATFHGFINKRSVFIFLMLIMITAGVWGAKSYAATNKAPTANPQNVVTDEDTPVAITLTGTDPENSTLTYNITRTTRKGSLSCSNAGSPCTYTPTTNLNGYDFFTFTVTDTSGATSRQAWVEITVNPINDAPTISVSETTNAEDVTATIRPTIKDVDGDALILEIVTEPSHGQAMVNGGAIAYVPNENYNGTDSVQIRVSDGMTTSNSVTASLTITPVNDVPTVIDQDAAGTEDIPLAITLAATDVDGNPLSVTFGYQSTHGELSANDTTVTYTPNAEFSGQDEFTYRVTDGSAWSTSATVHIEISAVNDAPVIQNQDAEVIAGSAVVVDLSATDAESDSITYALATSGNLGNAAVIGNHLFYQTTQGMDGQDVVHVTASDSSGLTSEIGLVTLTVLPEGTVVPISITHLEQIPGVTVSFENGTIVTTLTQSSCSDFIATPILVPVQRNTGEVVEAVAATWHSKCSNITDTPHGGFLVMTDDGSAWRFTSEREMDLRPDAQATGHYDPLGTLSYPLVSIRNDSGDPDMPMGRFVQYTNGETIVSDTHIGRLLDSSVLSFDGILALFSANPATPTCSTGKKINAEYCGVPVFLNKLSQSILDFSFFVDNGLEAWNTAAATRVKQVDSQGNIIQDRWAIGFGPGGNMGEAADVGGGCKGVWGDTQELRDAILEGRFRSFNFFAHTFDPGDPGCAGLRDNPSLTIQGSALQGEATIGFDPATGAPRVWFKGFQPDVSGDSRTRISQVDLETGSPICDVLIEAGSNRSPFKRTNTGLVIDDSGNAYTEAEFLESGIQKTGILKITPDCQTEQVMKFTIGQVNGAMSGVTLAQDTQGHAKILGVVGGNLYIYDLATQSATTYPVGGDVVAAPVIDSAGDVIVVDINTVITIFPKMGLSYHGFWPRFRHDNFGTGTATIRL